MCAALDEPMPLSDQVASNLCRSGKFPTCERFQSVHPNWQPPESPTVETGIPGGRQLLSSLAWVIGIPTAITFLIVLAIWITENVWVPTQSALPVIFY